MPVSFFPAAPPPQPLSYPSSSKSCAPARSHDIAITITDEDGFESVLQIPEDTHSFECAIELPGQEFTPPIRGLLKAIRTDGFMQAMTDLIAPHMEPGSPGWTAVKKTGAFNVSQLAAEIPTGVPGVTFKGGIQANIVKPDVFPPTSNWYLQLFPVHDEMGFNLLDTFNLTGIKEFLPAWCGINAQVIRNHGVNIPIVHTEAGWRLMGPNEDNGAQLMMEWVVRPAEIDLKYATASQASAQSTQTLAEALQTSVGLEMGIQLMWDWNGPQAKWALMSSAAANLVGMGAGFAAATASGGNPMLFMHGGGMLGQLAAHGVQCASNSMCPSKVIAWAGATLGAFDANVIPREPLRCTDYLRFWGHVFDGEWEPCKLKQEAENALVRFFAEQRAARAIDAAEKGFEMYEMPEMGIDNTAYPPQTHLHSISARYDAQQ